jgi:Ca-activated chloride channel family protein
VFDLSRSMDASDVTPSRLIRAGFKLQDLLTTNLEGQVALVAFAGEPYTVSPLTDDAATISTMVRALSTDLVPVQGSRVDLALGHADALLRQAGAHGGEIVLITDGAQPAQAAVRAAREVRRRGARVSVLGVGTAAGAPILIDDGKLLKDRGGAIVIPRLNEPLLRDIAAAGGGLYHTLSDDDRDLSALQTLRRSHVSSGAEREAEGRTTDRWSDVGPWLLLALVPLALLGFRRGWIYLVVLLPLAPPPAHALDWNDLWLRPDQQGARAMSREQYAPAAGLFRDPDWKGAALYRGGQYEQAAEAFARVPSASAHYNRGNALARMGNFADALQAYQQALDLNPELEDARANHELVNELIKQQQAQSGAFGKAEQGGENSDPDMQEQSAGDAQRESTQGGERRQQAGESPKLVPDDVQQARQGGKDNTRTKQAPGEDETQTAQDHGKARTDTETGADAQSAQSNEDSTSAAQSGDKLDLSESQQALEQWLRRIPDDPGGLLREKFRREHQRRRGKPQITGNTW